MFDVASRTFIWKSSTGPNVGPSTYVLCNPRNRRQNYAPFLSTRPISPSFIGKLNTEAIYDVRTCKTRIRLGSSLRNRAKRFVYKESDTPAPTKYNARPYKCKKCPKLDPNKPKLFACVMPYNITVTAPSIPTKIDENGYDLDKEGNIIKVPPDKITAPPLNLRAEFPRTNGCKWSHRTSKRFDDKKFLTPGPGPASYFVEIPTCACNEQDEQFREMARRFSFLPRYVEMQEVKAGREGKPGPGVYDIEITSKPVESIKPRPFIVGAPRFKNFQSDSPAPTSYKICDCSTKHKQFSTKCAPFGFDSPRFNLKKTDPNAPSPASYDIKGPIQVKIEGKKNKFALFEPPFNQTAMRKIGFAGKDAACTPSPADYAGPLEAVDDLEETEVQKSSVFKSRVPRFCSPTEKQEITDPAKYNITKSYRRSHGKKSFNVGKAAFFSSGPRSTFPVTKSEVPCPTSYDNECPALGDSGYHFNLTPRFKSLEETPGPATYNIHPAFQAATYKAWDTSNLRLKENIVRKKLRLAPCETRKKWCSVMKKKKLLNWFDVLPDFDEQMCLLVQKLFENPI